MSDEWYPDPLGRADLRRHDGTGWTHDVITHDRQSTEARGLPLPRSAPGTTPAVPPAVTYVPTAPAWAPTPRPASVSAGNGLLVAAGALGVVTGAVTLLAGIWVVRLTSAVNALTCNVALPSCGHFAGAYLIGILIVAIGAIYLVAGIAACMGRRRGQSALIVLGSLALLLLLVDLIAGGTDALIPMVWFGLITGLAWVGRTSDFA